MDRNFNEIYLYNEWITKASTFDEKSHSICDELMNFKRAPFPVMKAMSLLNLVRNFNSLRHKYNKNLPGLTKRWRKSEQSRGPIHQARGEIWQIRSQLQQIPKRHFAKTWYVRGIMILCVILHHLFVNQDFGIHDEPDTAGCWQTEAHFKQIMLLVFSILIFWLIVCLLV